MVHHNGSLEVWHIYLALIISGIADSIEVPALMGSITLMGPKSQYGRASGLQGLAGTASSIFAPVAAVGLLTFFSLKGILGIDLATFGLALLTLGITPIPQPLESETGKEARGSFLQDLFFGFKFILERPSLLGLQTIWMSANFLAAIGTVLVAPLVLARTAGDTLVLSGVEAVLSAGAVARGLLISAWGGPKKKV